MQSSLESICDLLNFDNGEVLMKDAHDTINHADTPNHQILDVGDGLDESVANDCILSDHVILTCELLLYRVFL